MFAVLYRYVAAGNLLGITEGALELIADTAAGNARKAISIFREAHVEGKVRDRRVTPTLSANVHYSATKSIPRYNVERLDTPHCLLKHMIDDAGESQAGGLVALFELEYPDAHGRDHRRYLNSLVLYGCIPRNVTEQGTLNLLFETAE
ncbi:hypothetical protein [Halobaculum limi]|uniref:hypothetical protein n=1 Tax=Halobaculum limi TaxID=3031916 RepID=UPI002405E300|nr:hypothetical protein [Halobaculum sp. YSMS11]